MSNVLKKKVGNSEIVDIDFSDVKDSQRGSSADFYLDNFDLKSEFYETNVNLPDIKSENENEVTTVAKVFTGDSYREIHLNDLTKFLKEQKDVKKVVIEKISVREATRVSFLFEPSWEGDKSDSLLSSVISNQSEQQKIDFRKKSLSDQEFFLNQDFLTGNGSSPDDSLESSLGDSDKENILKFNNINKENNTNKASIENNSHETTETSKENSSEVHDSVTLSLKSESNKDRNLQYTKQTLTKKKSQNFKSYYYRAKDHMELFKVGSSYMRDYKSGLKNFSFSSFGLKTEKEKTVFGICSYFNYHEDIDVCIITSDFEQSFYQEYIGSINKESFNYLSEEIPFDIIKAKGFDAIEYSSFRIAERGLKEHNLEDLISEIFKSYDVVLWDLPDMGVLDSNKEVYFPIIRTLDNVSFVIGQDRTKNSEIHTLLNYYKRYQVPVKGLLFNPLTKKGAK
tara:strand:+ start:37226 stop:38587 length:1362 start_codon:yes stop_codon:yes gene_type:complete